MNVSQPVAKGQTEEEEEKSGNDCCNPKSIVKICALKPLSILGSYISKMKYYFVDVFRS